MVGRHLGRSFPKYMRQVDHDVFEGNKHTGVTRDPSPEGDTKTKSRRVFKIFFRKLPNLADQDENERTILLSKSQ